MLALEDFGDEGVANTVSRALSKSEETLWSKDARGRRVPQSSTARSGVWYKRVGGVMMRSRRMQQPIYLDNFPNDLTPHGECRMAVCVGLKCLRSAFIAFITVHRPAVHRASYFQRVSWFTDRDRLSRSWPGGGFFWPIDDTLIVETDMMNCNNRSNLPRWQTCGLLPLIVRQITTKRIT